MTAGGASPAANGLEPWMDLKNKVVMVTGASSGIGRELCLDLAKCGCRIIAAARRVDRLQSLCEEINSRFGLFSSNKEGGGARAVAVAVELDVSASGSVIDAAVAKAWGAFGRIDALINNAGIRGSVHLLLDLSEDEWNEVTGTNLTGTWLVSKSVCTRMRDAHQTASVVNISSIAGLNRGQLPGSVIYSASKAAINTMTKVMAVELGPYNIRVNSISPGIFKSELTKGLVDKHWFKTVGFKTIPLQTHGTTDPALTSLVRYLIHDTSEYVTGNVFIVDAGATIPGTPIFSSL
ncbi:uncharacterized protein LOC127264243 isoform X2 [Andrographis paniculata]|uniref:uncharacterized protein LOC127264243 isoform X2 n=1 Tax=Andrographis paniculata TaxID=175694 RepID=UPI0021E8B2B1|nr:uncharacterized protein LOC127264243 isoform X2 [Andrographis paniculata]